MTTRILHGIKFLNNFESVHAMMISVKCGENSAEWFRSIYYSREIVDGYHIIAITLNCTGYIIIMGLVMT